MSFSERVPSTEWAPVTHLGEEVAHAWFRPDGDPLAVVFRVPRSRLEVEDLSQLPSVEDLLAAAAVPVDAVESWHFLAESHLSQGGTNLELKRLLPPPPPDEADLTVRVRLKAPAPADAGGERPAQDVSPEQWQDLDALWKTIQTLEAAIDSLRMGMDGLRSELESALRKTLNVDEKVHALQADVAVWTKAKNLGRFSLPKLREFVHRATWAAAAAERKRLEEIVETYLGPRVPPPDLDLVRDQLGHLQKDRQVLLAQGNAVNQECRGVLGEIQRAVSTLQRNATDRQRQKRSAGRDKGKHL